MTFPSWLDRHAEKLRWGSIAAILIAAIAVVRLLPLNRGVDLLEQSVESLGILGPLVFAAAYFVGALAFVPGALLTLTAGAAFGLGVGTIIVSAASTSTAAAAFLIARYLARGKVEEAAANYPRFQAIDEAVRKGGWKIVGLLRLSPAVPFSLSNYLFGLTPVRFGPYVLTSFLPMLPGTFMYVYLGYAGRAGAEAAAGAEGRSLGEWALLAVGLLATIVVTVYVTRLARRELSSRTDLDTEEDTPDQASEPANVAGKAKGAIVMACIAAVFVAGAFWAYANQERVDSFAISRDRVVSRHLIAPYSVFEHQCTTGGLHRS